MVISLAFLPFKNETKNIFYDKKAIGDNFPLQRLQKKLQRLQEKRDSVVFEIMNAREKKPNMYHADGMSV